MKKLKSNYFSELVYHEVVNFVPQKLPSSVVTDESNS